MPKLACLTVALLAVTSCSGGTPAGPNEPVSPTAPTTTSPTGSDQPVGASTVTGVVTDNWTSEGVEGATVSVTDGVNTGRVATTDRAGRYTLLGLVPGRMTLTASRNLPGSELTTSAYDSFSQVFDLYYLSQTVDLVLWRKCVFKVHMDGNEGHIQLPRGLLLQSQSPFQSTETVRTVNLRLVAEDMSPSCKWTFTSSEPWATLTPTSGTAATAATLHVQLSPVPERCVSMLIGGARLDMYNSGIHPPGYPPTDGSGRFCESYFARFGPVSDSYFRR